MRTPTEILTDLQAAVKVVERLQSELSDSMRIKAFTTKDRAIAKACKVWDVSPSQMANGCRHQRTVNARMFAWKLMRLDGYDDYEIGRAFNRDRSTINYGLHKLKDLLETDKEIQEKWKMI